MITTVVQWYLGFQVLVVVGWALTRALPLARLDARGDLLVGRVLLVSAFLLPALAPSFPAPLAWQPPAFVTDLAAGFGAIEVVTDLALVRELGSTYGATGSVPAIWAWLLGIGVVSAIVWATVSWWRLDGLVRRSDAAERIGPIQVRVSPEIPVPFAAWLPGLSVVLLDDHTDAHEHDRPLALAHERQHHHHQDPKFAYLVVGMRALSVWNPFAHLWARSLQELDEFAVDAAIMERGDVSAKAYGRCLVHAARRAQGLPADPTPSLATALTRKAQASLLHRRLQRLATPPTASTRAAPALVVGLAVMSVSAWATEGSFTEQGLAPETVFDLAAQSCEMDVVYPADEQMADALVRLAGSAAGVRFVEQGVERSATHGPAIQEALVERRLPAVLAAVPLVESGYDPGFRDATGAGLWGLSEDTAIALGLTVDEARDERFDTDRATEVALDYFVALYNEFGDWGLVLAAYNQGPPHVRAAMAEEGTDDPWTLARTGALDEYASTVLAAALMMKVPTTTGTAEGLFDLAE